MTDTPQTRASVEGAATPPKPGHDTFVTVTNALLEARDKANAAGTLYETFNLRACFGVLLALGLDQATCLEALHDHGDKYPGAAAAVDVDDDLEVDDKPLFSRSDEGTWVSAWVFVRDPEEEDGDDQFSDEDRPTQQGEA